MLGISHIVTIETKNNIIYGQVVPPASSISSHARLILNVNMFFPIVESKAVPEVEIRLRGPLGALDTPRPSREKICIISPESIGEVFLLKFYRVSKTRNVTT